MKNPLTPAGIESATFRFVAQLECELVLCFNSTLEYIDAGIRLHKALNLVRYFPEIVSRDVSVPWKKSDSSSAMFIARVYRDEFHFIFFIRLYAFACYSPGELSHYHFCRSEFHNIITLPNKTGCFKEVYMYRGSTVAKVLCYKSESRWFDPTWGVIGGFH